MKTFKVFEHIENQPTKEIEFTECKTAMEVADLIFQNVDQLLKANNAHIDEENIETTMSNIHSTGFATTFQIFSSVLDYVNQENTQESFHYTIVEIEK